MKKVLWVTATPFKFHKILLGQNDSCLYTGSWLNASLDIIKQQYEIELHIVTIDATHNYICGQEEGVYYHVLPKYSKKGYNIDSKKVVESWSNFRDQLQPDIIHIWGTESTIALVASRIFKGSPIIVFMQGFIDVIKQHYYDGMPYFYRYSTIRDFFNQYRYKKQSLIEREILNNATAAIVENSWGESLLISINPNIAVHKVQLPIRKLFYNNKWDDQNYDQCVLFTNAGGYPIKGHHILFIVKKTYPNVKLIIPGPRLDEYNSFIRKTGYIIYLKQLIKKHNLQNNIEYIGTISSDEMIKRLKKCNAYIMPSVSENHSASLIEALLLGVPCISSCVGETINHIQNGRNGFLYNSTDWNSLAGLIIKILSDTELSKSMGREALNMQTSRNEDFGEKILRIYKSIC